MYTSHINNIHVEVTDRCNAECPVCPRSLGGGHEMPYVKNQELGLDYFKLIDKVFLSRIEHWNFCGVKGDPASAQELFEILDYILDCNPLTQIDIRTNGGARNEKFWTKVGERLKGTNGQVVWSVDGWEHTNHIYRRNVKWSKLFANMNSYIDTGADSRWEFNKFQHNIQDLGTIRNFCRVRNIHLDVREPYGFSVVTEVVTNQLGKTDRQERDLHGVDGKLNNEHSKIKSIPVYKRGEDDTSILEYTIKPHDVPKSEIIDKHKPIEHGALSWEPGVYDIGEFTKYKNTTQDILCKALDDTQEIYIDSNGMIFPCCYTAGKFLMGDEQINTMIRPYKRQMRLSEEFGIYDVLKLDLFKKVMPDGMDGSLDDKNGYCITCVQHCGK
tara:strand:- start:4280 stop:5434 length:1155 start_codon:yes stop_codon:yes gene_type:complete